MRVTLFISLFLLFGGCTAKNKELVDTQVETTKSLNSSDPIESHGKSRQLKSQKKLIERINKMTYEVKYMTALDFLQRNGAEIDPADLEKLEKEQVVLFEITSDNPNKEIWEESRMKMSKEDAINYLGAGIVNDFQITQNKKEISPNDVSFEGILGEKNRLRCVFFFADVNLKKEFEIRFYDRLFESGMMRFNS